MHWLSCCFQGFLVWCLPSQRSPVFVSLCSLQDSVAVPATLNFSWFTNFFFLLLLQSQTFASNFACNSWQFWYRRTCFEQVNSTIFHSSKTSQCEPSLLSAAPVLHLQLNLWSAYVSIKCAYGTKNSYSLVLASLACISFFCKGVGLCPWSELFENVKLYSY